MRNWTEDQSEIELYQIAKILVYLCLFYLFFYKNAIIERRIILYSTAICATIVMSLDLALSREDFSNIFSFGVILNPIMCIYSILTGLLVAYDQSVMIGSIKTYGAFSLISLLISYISLREKDIQWIIDGIIVIDLISAIFVLFRGTYILGYGYTLGLEQNPNSFGVIMSLGLFCLAVKKKDKTSVRLICSGLGLLFLYTIIGCGSRKSLIAALIICSIWIVTESCSIWQAGKNNERIIWIICVFSLVIIGILFYRNIYVHTDLFNRMKGLGSEEEGSSSLRVKYYKYAIDFFLERPLFGIGFDQFRIWNPYHAYAHSTYAEALADWGLVGCLLYFTPGIWAGRQLVYDIVRKKEQFTAGCFVSLYLSEIFLGIGQIWFYEIEHLIAWTIIYSYIKISGKDVNNIYERKYKYVKAENCN